MIQRIVLVGAGNLATQAGKALHKAGIKIVQVYSRTEANARELASKLDSGFTVNVEEIDLSVDLVLIAVKDDAIGPVAEKLSSLVSATVRVKPGDKSPALVARKADMAGTIIAHTAGSVSLNVLEGCSRNYGVFYPLQTFSKGREVDFSEIPICIEANSEYAMNELKGLAQKVSGRIYEVDSVGREIIHLSAVFACNFVNHFYHLGSKLLGQNGLPFDLLRPLIKETAAKAMELDPFDAQTGPAKRNDETIINKHLNLLNGQPELKKIYSFVTESIFMEHKNC